MENESANEISFCSLCLSLALSLSFQIFFFQRFRKKDKSYWGSREEQGQEGAPSLCPQLHVTHQESGLGWQARWRPGQRPPGHLSCRPLGRCTRRSQQGTPGSVSGCGREPGQVEVRVRRAAKSYGPSSPGLSHAAAQAIYSDIKCSMCQFFGFW